MHSNLSVARWSRQKNKQRSRLHREIYHKQSMLNEVEQASTQPACLAQSSAPKKQRGAVSRQSALTDLAPALVVEATADYLSRDIQSILAQYVSPRPILHVFYDHVYGSDVSSHSLNVLRYDPDREAIVESAPPVRIADANKV